MSRYGDAECIECGRVGERLLHPGFPHICRECLFPPIDANDPRLYRSANTSPLADVLFNRATHSARKLA